MSKTVRGLPEWANISLKVLVIMIFPLSVYGENLLQLFILPTSGLLFTPTESYYVWLTDITYLSVLLGTILRNLFIGILVAVPGIYYTYKLSRVPVNQSYWKRGLGTAIAIYFLVLGLITYMFSSMISPIGFRTYDFWLLSENLIRYTTLVMGVFIILPLVQRQAVIIGSPSDLHQYSMREIESYPKLNLSREKILGAIFWFFLCFSPFIIFINPYYWGGGYAVSGFMMNINLDFNLMRYFDMSTFFFGYNILDFSQIPFYVLMGAFHFVFVRDAYRYLRKNISKQRLIRVAIVSSIFPFFISIGLSTAGILYFGILPFPIPILQLSGFFIVRFHRPLADQTTRIWMGDKSRMRWERDERGVHIESAPEKLQHRRNKIVTVSVGYLLLSRIRQLKQRLRR